MTRRRSSAGCPAGSQRSPDDTGPARSSAEARGRLRHRRLVVAMLAEVVDGIASPLELRVRPGRRARPHGLPTRTPRPARPAARPCGSTATWPTRRSAPTSSWTARCTTATSSSSGTQSATTSWSIRGAASLRYGWVQVHGRPCRVACEVGAVLQSRGLERTDPQVRPTMHRGVMSPLHRRGNGVRQGARRCHAHAAKWKPSRPQASSGTFVPGAPHHRGASGTRSGAPRHEHHHHPRRRPRHPASRASRATSCWPVTPATPRPPAATTSPSSTVRRCWSWPPTPPTWPPPCASPRRTTTRSPSTPPVTVSPARPTAASSS